MLFLQTYVLRALVLYCFSFFLLPFSNGPLPLYMAQPISCPVQGYKNAWCKLRDSSKIGVEIEKLSGQKKSLYNQLVSSSLLLAKLKKIPTELFIHRLLKIVLDDARPLSWVLVYNLKGVQRIEWHCDKILSISISYLCEQSFLALTTVKWKIGIDWCQPMSFLC